MSVTFRLERVNVERGGPVPERYAFIVRTNPWARPAPAATINNLGVLPGTKQKIFQNYGSIEANIPFIYITVPQEIDLEQSQPQYFNEISGEAPTPDITMASTPVMLYRSDGAADTTIWYVGGIEVDTPAISTAVTYQFIAMWELDVSLLGTRWATTPTLVTRTEHVPSFTVHVIPESTIRNTLVSDTVEGTDVPEHLYGLDVEEEETMEDNPDLGHASGAKQQSGKVPDQATLSRIREAFKSLRQKHLREGDLERSLGETNRSKRERHIDLSCDEVCESPESKRSQLDSPGGRSELERGDYTAKWTKKDGRDKRSNPKRNKKNNPSRQVSPSPTPNWEVDGTPAQKKTPYLRSVCMGADGSWKDDCCVLSPGYDTDDVSKDIVLQ